MNHADDIWPEVMHSNMVYFYSYSFFFSFFFFPSPSPKNNNFNSGMNKCYNEKYTGLRLLVLSLKASSLTVICMTSICMALGMSFHSLSLERLLP